MENLLHKTLPMGVKTMVPHATIAAILLLVSFSALPLPAQSMQQIVESFTRSRTTTDQQKNEASAAEQLPWVEEQLVAARKRIELAQSEAFKAKLEASSFPPARGLEIVQEASEAADLWVSAENLLEWIVAQEVVDNAPQEPPAAPGDPAAAFLLENQYEELKSQLSRLEFEASAQAEVISRAEQQQRAARRELAELKMEAESNRDAATQDRLDIEILQEAIRKDAADAQLFNQRWLKYRYQLEIQNLQARSDAIRQVLDQSGYRRLLSATRAQMQIELIEKTLPSLEKEEQVANQEFEVIAKQLAELRARVSEVTADGNPPSAELQKQLQNALAQFSQQEAMRSAVNAHLMTLRHSSGLWRRVLDLLQNPTLENLRRVKSDLATQQPNTSAMLDRIDRMLAEKRNNGDRLRQDLRMPGISQAERNELQKQIETNLELTEKLLALQNDVASMRNFQNRLIEEIDLEIAALLAQKQWLAVIKGAYDQVKGVWDFQITEQGNRVVTLGTIVTAILALIVAILVARLAARRISLMAERRFKIGTSQTHLIEKLTLYALSVILILTVLQWLQIPLTVFAFLGGALAVGIGFGSQNLINNFISGLLLLLERKINVGDLVEVDGNFGKVINLGSRCSAIRKFDGVEVLVPNSSLLEKNVINWTLSDPMHRFDFAVGVAYGSDVELVMRTLQEAMDAQPEIVRDPAPEVAFEDFADSTLNFHVYYWLLIGVHNGRQIGTELRTRITKLFKERNLEMAFPQRDVHLLSEKPIDVRLAK